jgi:hypothetical protein
MKSSRKYAGLITAGLLLLLTFPLSALNPEQKEFEVSGTVISGDNYPIPGVNIIIKGTADGTVTDQNGNFSITVPDENTVLYFSCYGYRPTEITVGPNRVLPVTLIRSGPVLSQRGKGFRFTRESGRPTFEELMEKAREDMKKQLEPDWEYFRELLEEARGDMEKQVKPDWDSFWELMEKAGRNLR